MMTRKALLILIGGRQIPNLLTVQSLKPDIIVPITSKDSGDVWQRIKPVLQQLCPDGLQEQIIVDPFDLEEINQACLQSIQRFPDAEWFFNITCATTIMSIGAYQVAQQHNINAWYLDTRTRRVVTLAGEPPKSDLYKLTVADYMAVYGRKPTHIPNDPTQQQIDFSQLLAKHPQEAMAFREVLRKSGVKEKAQRIQLEPLTPIQGDLCRGAEQAGMLADCQFKPSGEVACRLADPMFWKFIDSDWLEIYAWDAARSAGCFDYYHYGVSLPMKTPEELAKNEIDLAAISAATLLIAECKTENRFHVNHLDQLRAIASMIGGSFVGTILISSLCSSFKEQGQQTSFENFCSQARERSIVIVTGEELPDLTAILQREVEKPTYFRG